MTDQPFPAGAAIHDGRCYGVFCDGAPADVVATLLLPFRLTNDVNLMAPDGIAMDLCADCLADYAIATSDPEALATLAAHGIPGDLHAYAQGLDGKFHEVTGRLP